MSGELNVSLSNEVLAFIQQNTGEGKPYATASEFVQQALREQMLRQEAEKFRETIVAGYEDAIAGRVVEFTGDLKSMLEDFSE